MHLWVLIAALLGLSTLAYYLARRRSVAVVGGFKGIPQLHSLPSYYGFHAALWAIVPALLVLGIWTAGQDSVVAGLVVAQLPPQMQTLPPSELGLIVNNIKNLATGNIVSGEVTPVLQQAADHYTHLQNISRAAMAVVVLVVGSIAGGFAWRSVSPRMRARNRVETILTGLLVISSTIAIFTTVGIVLSVLFESIRFFNMVSIWEFLFGLEWSPQISLRADQVGSSGAFGAVPLLTGTLLISFIAMLVAVPIGLMSAIYLSEYADRKFRAAAKPVLEVLAGIPTVVYGFFAALTVAPFVRDLGASVGLDVSSESALAAGLVMGIMIIPFVSSLSDDVINAVPQAMRDGSFALGATRYETVRKVIIPAALPGIVGGIGRAHV